MPSNDSSDSKTACPKCGRHQFVTRLRWLSQTKVEYACLDRPWMGFRGCGHKWTEEGKKDDD